MLELSSLLRYIFSRRLQVLGPTFFLSPPFRSNLIYLKSPVSIKKATKKGPTVKFTGKWEAQTISRVVDTEGIYYPPTVLPWNRKKDISLIYLYFGYQPQGISHTFLDINLRPAVRVIYQISPNLATNESPNEK